MEIPGGVLNVICKGDELRDEAEKVMNTAYPAIPFVQ